MATLWRPTENAEPGELATMVDELLALRSEMLALEAESGDAVARLHGAFEPSGRNLLHYLALRRHDLRPLQRRLAALGLSSLGRAESHVLDTIDAVLRALNTFLGRSPAEMPNDAPVDFALGERLLDEHTRSLFGEPPPGRDVRIMVTMPEQAGRDYGLVHRLVEAGMDCMRINCAHDDQAIWLRMIEHLRRAERALGRSCRIVMDLAGPKLRTAPLEPGPAVVKVRPGRDPLGNVIEPARVWLGRADTRPAPPSEADATFWVARAWLGTLEPAERIRFRDGRGARRRLTVVDVSADGAWAELDRTAYLVPGTKLTGRSGKSALAGPIEPVETAIPLESGDQLIVARDRIRGRPAVTDRCGRVLTPATVGCTLPRAFDFVAPGDRILFDDGKIGGLVETIEPNRVSVRITQTKAGGGRLRGDRGINLPDSDLELDPLTEHDLAVLPFLAKHADLVALSFASEATHLTELRARLEEQDAGDRAVVLKIETRRGFENLPAMLLAALEGPSAGVMIARGDLAVECGFERLAEVQEEILWLSEAAHVPVIWATQVLESLAKTGMPSRAEISDAVMGHRAECVMLNKGPHVVLAVEALDDILRRMEGHQAKKRAMLRELRLARAFEGSDD